MSMNDPLADMLTRIRNAVMVNFASVDIPFSNMKGELARILKEEGYIKGYKVLKDKKQGVLRISLKYSQNSERVITGLKRISKPGRRVYVDKDNLPRVMGGIGVGIVSTSGGVKSDRSCRRDGEHPGPGHLG